MTDTIVNVLKNIPPGKLLDYQVLTNLNKSLGFNPKCIFDLGAAKGGWSSPMSGIFPEAAFHLFEPLADHSPLYHELLTKEMALHPNWTLHKYAVGEHNAQAKFYVHNSL